MTLTETDKEILQSLQVDDNVKTVTITRQLDRKQYQRTNELLETAGGTWSRKAKAHVFVVAPSAALKVFISGQIDAVTTTIETKKERKKTYQFFATPDKLANELVAVAFGGTDFENWQPKNILEPSAGQGSIVKAINRWYPHITVDVYELMEENRTELVKLPCRIIGIDFLSHNSNNKYDAIVANPPFAKHADIIHIRKMYDCLADGGRLVTVSGNHWRHASHKIDREFKEWLESDSVRANVYEITAETFKESGTTISANYIVISK
jgi:hypothetical protein